MLTKERILELLGDTPEKLERWEQEAILLENSQESILACHMCLHNNNVPFKRIKLRNYFPEDVNKELLSFSLDNLDRKRIIELARMYKICPTSILDKIRYKTGTQRKVPDKDTICKFYSDYLFNNNGKSFGWKKEFCNKYSLEYESFLKFLKKHKLHFANTHNWNKEQALYLKKIVEDSYKEEVFTQVSNFWEYITDKYNAKYAKRSKSAIYKFVVSSLGNDCCLRFKKLQDEFIQNLIKSRDLTISKRKCAKEWSQKYPIRSFNTYKESITCGSVIQCRNKRNLKQSRLNKRKFIDNLPNSLTEEQKKQIIKAYEKASY